MMLFFVIVFFMFLCLLGYPYEIMEFIKKNWRELLLSILTLIIIILSIWISVINKTNPEVEFKIKQYDVLIKQQDSIINNSIELQKQLAEKGNNYIDTTYIYQNIIDKQINDINKFRNEKDKAIKSVEYLNSDVIDKLFDSLAREYRLSKKRL